MIAEMLGATETNNVDPNGTDFSFINCERLKHAHECRCHLGHLCESGCQHYDKLIKEQQVRDENGNLAQPHALFQLAAEAPSDVMRGVFERLHTLEQDNAALKNLLTKVLLHLPKEIADAAATDALREKIGLPPLVGEEDETSRSLASFQETGGNSI